MNNGNHSLSREKENDDFKESKNVPNILIQIIETNKIPWKSTHMNNIINSIKLSEDKVINDENRIIEKIKSENILSFELMRFVLEKNEIIQNMFDFVYELEFIKEQKIIVKDINEKIWEFADLLVLQRIVKISNFINLDFYGYFIYLTKKFKFDIFTSS